MESSSLLDGNNQRMSRINPYERRQLLATILRLILISLYLAMIPSIFILLRDLSPEHIVSRIIPYGVPPFISCFSAIFLSLFVLSVEQHRTVTLPFSIICFCYALLNLDILLVSILPDITVALWVSRLDHFFLAMLIMGANLHLVYLIIEKKDQWWVVYAGYLIGFAIAPLTMTRWYFQGMYTYHWGFFAQKAALYDVMSTLWALSLLYTIYLFFKTFGNVDEQRKRYIKNVFIAIVLLAAISMMNTPAIYGYEIYPFGTFIFTALFYLTYNLFKFNAVIALQYMRSVLYWSCLIILLIAAVMAPGLVLTGRWKVTALPLGIILAAVLNNPLRYFLDRILNFFILNSTEAMNESYRAMTEKLSHVHHLDEVHRILKSWFFEVFNSLSYTSVFTTDNGSTYAGWTCANESVHSGLFGTAGGNQQDIDYPVRITGNDPLISLCSGAKALMTHDDVYRAYHGADRIKDESGLMKDAEIIFPIMAHDRLVAVFLLGGKLDGSRYSRLETDSMGTMALFLGPHVENAKLLENLEKEVEIRTGELRDANEMLQFELAERRRVDKMRLELEERLIQSQKMETIGLLAGGVAHDLNNVLSGIVSYPDLILMELPADSPIRKFILTMRDSGQKAASIVQDLLALTRRGVMQTEVIDMNEQIVHDYLNSPEHAVMLKKYPGSRLELNLEPDLFMIKGSPIHVKKCLMNLILNSMEAQPEGGCIRISTASIYVDTPLDGYAKVSEGEYVILSVEDDGVGIRPEDLKRIFEPFYTKKIMGKSGTGLGMTVVWGTVQDHNGYIEAHSTPGKGSRFDLYFPATREELGTVRTPTALEDYLGHGEHVLVVDDMPEQREITSTILSKLSYSVTTVASGEEAVAFLRTGQADLVLLDMIMDPGMDGLDTYKQIREIRPDQKVIIASGFAENERVKEAHHLGVKGFIRKPYTIEKLGIAIREVLDSKERS